MQAEADGDLFAKAIFSHVQEAVRSREDPALVDEALFELVGRRIQENAAMPVAA